jgi:hypothetical protein
LLDKAPYFVLDLKREFVKENEHEIFSIFVQACDLEDIYNIMYIEFSQVVWQDGSDEIGMALIVEVISAEDLVHFDPSAPFSL